MASKPPHNFIDLTGRYFAAHDLTVLERAGTNGSRQALWRCRRDDGTEVLRTASYLRAYSPKRARAEPHVIRDQAKGEARTREYRAWRQMIYRCKDTDHPSWPEYGGKGIVVDPSWLLFETFRAALGPCPEGHQLTRLDTSKSYEPGNVRWMTKVDAVRATKVVRLIEYGGESLAMAAWAERTGVAAGTIRNRFRMGWPVAQALGFEPRSRPVATATSGVTTGPAPQRLRND